MLRFRTAAGVHDLVAGEPWRRQALEAVAALGLPDCWIGAGFVRAPVWDALHGYKNPTPLDDIDVVYHDPARPDPAAEAAAEARLRALAPGLPWSVRNQARMHLKNGDAPYQSTADALRHWLETPTAVAVRLGHDRAPELLAPLGLDDLLGLVLRPTPYARAHRMAAFRERVERKGWLKTWPKVRLAWH
ncbi:MAG: nucleotidyltransferase family protein [Rhodospirillales bacterium]|nr:nucleotidyltransferase family protein [Rhodospirillales bacterium]